MKPNFLRLQVYQLAEKLADEVWTIVLPWNQFAKYTIGKQLVNAADSVGSNIAEGEGRGSYQDNRRFVRIARGSLNEVRHWLRRAIKRNLLTPEQITILKQIMDELGPRLNAYLKSIGKVPNKMARKKTTDN
jgi:four helix bundle protein